VITHVSMLISGASCLGLNHHCNCLSVTSPGPGGANSMFANKTSLYMLCQLPLHLLQYFNQFTTTGKC